MAKALVFVESKGNEIKEASLEVLGLASSLAEQVIAVVVNNQGPDLTGHADKVLRVSNDNLNHPNALAYARVLAEAVKAENPDYILVAATTFGKELAPAAGALMDMTLFSDVVQVEKDRVVKPIYTGKVMAEYEINTPVLISVRPKAYPVPEKSKNGQAEDLNVSWEDRDLSVQLVELKEKDASEIDVAEADIVISGGRGMKGPENFDMLRELAKLLAEKTNSKVAIGASRSAVDEGWIDHSHQVGQTGKIVAPGFYFAIGISGAMQHIAGMRNSKIIIAVNKDPEAPIFQIADFGVVDDLFKVVPELINRLKNA